MISIVNYEMGNIRSVQSALDYLKVEHRVVSSPYEISKSEKLILPGVGSYKKAISNIKDKGLFKPIIESVTIRQTPILGICLGMQLLSDFGYEDGGSEGLSLISGQVRPLEEIAGEMRVPHIGFNSITVKKESKVLSENKEMNYFYFVHGFYFKCENEDDISAISFYNESFTCAIEKGNIFGVQFHPEKSQGNGLSVLEKFSKI